MSDSNSKQLFDLDLLSIPDLPDVSDNLFLENEIEQTVGKKYIVFLVSDKKYAIPAENVAEVVRSLAYTTLPNIPSWLLGIANLRGDIISIINLQIVLHSQPMDSPKSKFIVLRSLDSDSHIAFIVDKIREIVTFPEDKIKTNKTGKSAFSHKTIKHKSDEINLLDVEEILASLKIK